jgi:hypothetical protein
VLWDEGRWDGYAVRRQGNRHTQKQTPGVTRGSGERCTAGDGGRVLHLRIETFSGSHAYVTSADMQTAAALDVDDIITTGRPRTLHRAVSLHLPPPTMVMRLAVARPLGAVARSAGCSRAVRTFASTALRAKEVAGESKETPNMRVRQMCRAVLE